MEELRLRTARKLHNMICRFVGSEESLKAPLENWDALSGAAMDYYLREADSLIASSHPELPHDKEDKRIQMAINNMIGTHIKVKDGEWSIDSVWLKHFNGWCKSLSEGESESHHVKEGE